MNPLIPRGPYRIIGADQTGDKRIANKDRDLAIVLSDIMAPISDPAPLALATAFSALPDLIEELEAIMADDEATGGAVLMVIPERKEKIRAALAKANGEG